MSGTDPFDALAPSDPVALVLVGHQRHRGGCLCGGLGLGESHAVHIAGIVRQVIEAEVREQIAREIDEAAGKGWMAITGDYFRSISAELAIDIARGGGAR